MTISITATKHKASLSKSECLRSYSHKLCLFNLQCKWEKKVYGQCERVCVCMYTQAEAVVRGLWCDYSFAPIRRPPTTPPTTRLSLIRPTAAPSAPQSPSCHSGRPTDWKQSGLWWHNYPDPLTSRCCHNQALIRLLWASFTLQRRLIWASDGSVMGTGAGAAVRRSERAPANTTLDIVWLSIIVMQSSRSLTLWKSHFLPLCFFLFFFSSLALTLCLSFSVREWVGDFIYFLPRGSSLIQCDLHSQQTLPCSHLTLSLSLCLSPSLSHFPLSLILFLLFCWLWKGGELKKTTTKIQRKEEGETEPQ